MIVEQAIIERLVIPQRRKILVESVAEAGPEFQVDAIIPVTHGAFVVMALTAELLPDAAVSEINALVLGCVDIIGPK
jgi:hypothetical protein